MSSPILVRRFLGHAAPVEFCTKCDCESFVIDGVLACCGNPKTIDLTPWQRKKAQHPTKEQYERNRRGICSYCFRPFGAWVRKGQKVYQLRYQLDHFIPWSVSRDSSDQNLFAVCQICNSIKKDHVFKDIQQVRRFVGYGWLAGQYYDSKPPE